MTRHQVPRGTRADAEDSRSLYLIKNVRRMRLTYQIRLLALRALEEGKHLVIVVPKGAALSDPLKAFVAVTRPGIKIQRTA